MSFDPAELRDAFRIAHMIKSQSALWCEGYPGATPNTCRYCGRHWRQWVGSKLDGHAACIVTQDFKEHLSRLLYASPEMTYDKIAAAVGVSAAVVRSWTYPIRNTKRPVTLRA